MTEEEAEALGLWVNSDKNPSIMLPRMLKKEKNDCAVRSFAVAWDVSYDRAHHHLQQFAKRKHGGGLLNETMEDADKWCPKTLMKKGPYSNDNKITIKKFCEKHPVGRYWIGVSGHALAIVDGVVHDYRYGPRRWITLAWRVYGPKEV